MSPWHLHWQYEIIEFYYGMNISGKKTYEIPIFVNGQTHIIDSVVQNIAIEFQHTLSVSLEEMNSRFFAHKSKGYIPYLILDFTAFWYDYAESINKSVFISQNLQNALNKWIKSAYYLNNNLTNMTFSFRSIDIDKEFTRNYLQNELKQLNIESKILKVDELEDVLVINNKNFQIDYKNLVKPTFLKNNEYMTLSEYVKAKEKKLGKNFTLGNINPEPLLNGMGITIKPNGDVYFYGIESHLLGNIHIDNLNIFEIINI